MSIYSKIRRTIVIEGSTYKSSELFKNLNEEFDARDFINAEEKIPHEYRLYDPINPVDPQRDIKKLCERDLLNIVRGDEDSTLSKDPEDLEIGVDISSVYCNLYNFYQHLENVDKKETFIDNISRIFWFIRPNINDNRVKFHSLMRSILSSENVFESIRTLSDRIKLSYNPEGSDEDVPEAQDIKNALNRLKGQENLTYKEINRVLNSTKYNSYALYEKSFEKGPFRRINHVYNLKYKENLGEKSFKSLLDKAYKKIYKSAYVNADDKVHFHQVIDNITEELLISIIKSYNENDAIKADLVAEQDIKTVRGKTIIPLGGFVEVKMRDYSLDSYLSEYFSIYKEANISPKYKTPQMIEIYNSVINSLFKKIKTTNLSILDDIKSNFYGVFFGEKLYKGKLMPVFIPKQYIDIYWSNKGKIESNKQLRLSIRYKLNSDNIKGYFYNRETYELIPFNFNGNTNNRQIFGESKIIPRSILVEGRKEDAKIKYPQFSDEIFDFYVENDPSGNQKYLDWMLKSTILDSNQYDRVKKFSNDYHNSMVNAINYFHNNLQRFKKRDINSYSDLNELETEISVVKSKKSRKEERLEGGDKIFEDKNLTVVVPTNREGSCLYGANTRWCVSARDNNMYKLYREDGILFFLIWKLKMPENLENYQKIARYIPHGYGYETEGEYFLSNDTRMEGSDIESMLFGKRTYYSNDLGMVITHVPTKSKGVYDSWEDAKIAIDTYYAKNGMNLPNTRRLDDDFDEFDDFMTENLVLEGRKEDARAKYEDVDDDVFNYYADNDPSGNQKYLDWILNNVVGIYRGRLEPELMEMVKFFHRYQNMFVEKDINRHTITTLDREIDDVKEKLLQKEKKKEAKKQSTKLYEDDRWLAISPKSWEASCYYGAGTKWCVTMKDNSSYWRKYSKNATFIFIIDKTKPQEDPLYKVAYRMIGKRGKYELWNAPDHEISNSPVGVTYFEELPQELKDRSLKLHQENFPPVNSSRPEWVENDPRAQALLNFVDSDYIEDVEDYWWGLPIYSIDDDDYYAVGDSNEVTEAILEYYNDYSDDDLMEYYDYEGYYLTMNDEDGFINDEVDNYISETSENELLEMTGLDDERTSIEDEINELSDELYTLDSEEDSERIEEIEDEISTLNHNLEDLLEKAKEIASNSYRNEWENCLGDGVVSCLVSERGWFSNAKELYRSGLVELDRDGLLASIVDDSDYDVIDQNGWDYSTDDEDFQWIVYKIDY